MNDTTFFLGIARTCAAQSSCLKRQYGSVIVKDRKIISTGYNGAPAGMPHCTVCVRKDVPHGQDYTGCPSVHAEQNAMVQAGKESTGATIYVYGPGNDAKPCHLCTKLMINAGIVRVVYVNDQGTVVDTTPQKLYKEWITTPQDTHHGCKCGTNDRVRRNDITDKRTREEEFLDDLKRAREKQPGSGKDRWGVPEREWGSSTGPSAGSVAGEPAGGWVLVTVDDGSHRSHPVHLRYRNLRDVIMG